MRRQPARPSLVDKKADFFNFRHTGVQSGSFTIANGAVVSPDTLEVGGRAIPSRALRPVAEVYFADDVSARDGVCAGFDCTDTESYGFASAKLKENNTRLKFEDTSGAGFGAPAAVLTKVIQEQQRTIEDLQTRLQNLEQKKQ